MLATNFNDQALPRLNEILRFVLDSHYSDFYKNKYGSQAPGEIKSHSDFQKIPFLIKNEFLSIPVKERTFVPEEEIKYYSFSSGTTAAKKPLVMPHDSFYHEALFDKGILNRERLEKLGVKRLLVLMPPTSPGPIRLLTARQEYLKIILGDIHNLNLMAQVCQELAIGGLSTTATVLDFFIDELRSRDFDFASVKIISLGGEACSSLRMNHFKSVFPAAFFHARYGTSEIGGGKGRYYQCPALEGRTDIFHIKPDSAVLEIVDENGRILPMGEPGQIIYTELLKKAFPLIRYRTADIGSLSETACPCGSPLTLKLEGRYGTDIFRTHGVTINAEMAAEALRGIERYVRPRFQIHVYEKESGGKVKPQLQLRLQLKDDFKKMAHDFTQKEIFREKISAGFHLSAKATLKQLAEQGIFLPLELVFVDVWEETGSKSKRIISHLD